MLADFPVLPTEDSKKRALPKHRIMHPWVNRGKGFATGADSGV